MEKFLTGTEILRKYGLTDELSAQHDIIYVGCDTPPEQMSKEDAKFLEKMGCWYFEEEYECWSMFT